MKKTTKLRYDDLEIDKIPGAWVLTYWPPDRAGEALRLKFSHTSIYDPDEITAEIRLAETVPFQAVHQFSECAWSVTQDNWLGEDADLPSIRTDEFASMLLIWARVSMMINFGTTTCERYAGEPHDGRDHLVLRRQSEPVGSSMAE